MLVSFLKSDTSSPCRLICRNIFMEKWLDKRVPASGQPLIVILSSSDSLLFTHCAEITNTMIIDLKEMMEWTKYKRLRDWKSMACLWWQQWETWNYILCADGKSEWGGDDVCVLLLDLVLWFHLTVIKFRRTFQYQNIWVHKLCCCVCNKYESKAWCFFFLSWLLLLL